MRSNTHYNIYAGLSDNKSQILAGCYNNVPVMILFDLEGNLATVKEKPIITMPGAKDLEKEFPTWLTQINFKTAVITVKEFFWRITGSVSKVCHPILSIF